MPRPEQEPAETESLHGGRTFHHPAFGQIAISRVSDSGGAVLYGTDFRHHSYVQITISRSHLNRDLSRDWPHAYEEVLRLAMSEGQWAAFVSSFSVGSGVQCTFGHIGYEPLPGIPFRDSGQEYKAEADAKLADAIGQLEALRREMEGELEKVPRKVRESLVGKVGRALQQLRDNLPFVSRQFGEHMETRVEKAKVEVNAYVTNLVMRTGLEAMRGKGPLLEIEGDKRGEESGE